MKMNIEQILLDLKDKEERDQADISEMNVVDIACVDKYMIKPSAHLSSLDIIDVQMEEKMQQLARECYFVEASCQVEPSQLVSQFVEMCNACVESARRRALGNE